MTSNETSWSFPPALNITFRREFVENYNATEDAGDYKVYAVLSAAVQDLTLRERIASGFQNQGWGGEDAPVSVDDTVQGTFSTDEFMNFGLNCLLCKAGRESGSIEHACSNYTDSDNVVTYTKRFGPVPDLRIEGFPSLDQYESVPEDTCGLCIFTIFDASGSHTLDDYSVPFSVLQKKGDQRKVFNATYPTGVARPPRGSATYDIPTTPAESQSESDNSREDTGMIVGVVVGVLFVASCIMGLIIFLWTRKHRHKRTNPYSHPTLEHVDEPQDVVLQRVQSVVRRPDSSASEVPPPYHEAVRAKEAEP